jgi:c-di-GMP-binding flagellar brake protein YcgR
MYQKLLRENLRIEIIQEIETGKKRYPSRIEEVRPDSLVLANPMIMGTLVPLQLGDRIEIRFNQQEEVFSFFTRVLARRRLPIPVIDVERPANIRKIQRRDYVRFKISIPIEYRPAISVDNTFEQGTTIDVSGGGLLFTTRSEVKENELLEVRLKLPRETFVAIGLVVRVSQKQEGLNTVSLKFERLRERDRDTIIRFIFEKQREMLKKGLQR